MRWNENAKAQRREEEETKREADGVVRHFGSVLSLLGDQWAVVGEGAESDKDMLRRDNEYGEVI